MDFRVMLQISFPAEPQPEYCQIAACK